MEKINESFFVIRLNMTSESPSVIIDPDVTIGMNNELASSRDEFLGFARENNHEFRFIKKNS